MVGLAGAALLTGCEPQGGVQGIVTAGPACPVQQVDNPCPDRPVAGTVLARSAAGAVAGSAKTDATGHYAIPLPAGTYTLVVDTGARYPVCPATTVAVTAKSPAVQDISCDSGIR